MASTTLTSKPQQPKSQQAAFSYQQEAVPNVRPDFSVSIRANPVVNQPRPQNPPPMAMQANYYQPPSNPQPTQQGVNMGISGTVPPKSQPSSNNIYYSF